VPAVIRELAREADKQPAIRHALLRLHCADYIELLPDFGARFSRKDYEMCSPGPQQSRLLWAKPSTKSAS
jgi:hypothetical protein